MPLSPIHFSLDSVTESWKTYTLSYKAFLSLFLQQQCTFSTEKVLLFLRAVCDPNCTKNPLNQCSSSRHGMCIRTPLKKYFFLDYVTNILPTYRKEVSCGTGSAKRKSQPPHPEPLLNTKTIFTSHRNCSERRHFSEQHAYAAPVQRSHN